MRLHKRKLGFICSFLGLLMVALTLGMFSGSATKVSASSNVTVSMTFSYKVEDTDQLVQDITLEKQISPDELSSVTRKDIFDANADDSLRSPYTEIDRYKVYSQVTNKYISLDQGVQKINDMMIGDGNVVTSKDIKNDLGKARLQLLKGNTLDYDKIMQANAKYVKPEPVAGEPGQYTVPDFLVYLKPNDYSMTIKYLMPDGKTADNDWVVTGYAGEKPTTIASPAVTGYEPDQKNVKVDFAKAGDYTTVVHYDKARPIARTATPTTDQASLTADKQATIVTGQPINAATFNAKATDHDGQAIPVKVDTSKVNFKVAGTYPVTLSAENGKSVTAMLTVKALTAGAAAVAQKKSAILAVKPIYLYQRPTFNKHQRLAKYVKASRGERPMFVVLGYAHSKNGLLRYRVKDVNHKSKADGKIGYVTAKSAFVTPAYYQKTVKRVKVLNKSGVNEYRKVNLTGKTKHLKKNQTVKVIGLEHHNLTTRFKLSNGHYITANKNLVMIVK